MADGTLNSPFYEALRPSEWKVEGGGERTIIEGIILVVVIVVPRKSFNSRIWEWDPTDDKIMLPRTQAVRREENKILFMLFEAPGFQ